MTRLISPPVRLTGPRVLGLSRPRRARWVGLLLPLLLLGPEQAVGDVISDALQCLREQELAAAVRDRFLSQADSVGRVIEAITVSGKSAPEALLRKGEKIQSRAMEQELELVSRRLRCRDLAEKALVDCRTQIAAVEGRLRSGQGGSEPASRLLTLQDSRTQLENALSGPVTLRYPLLPSDSSDTQEVLRGKMQYYAEVRGRLHSLEERVKLRQDQMTEERRSLAEAQRFARDLDFLGEGGRVGPGPSLRGGDGLGGRTGGPGGLARAGSDSAAGSLSSRDLELVLGLTPTTTQESDQIIELLKVYRKEIMRELAVVDSEMVKVERRILPANERP